MVRLADADADPLTSDRGVKYPLADTPGSGSVLAAGVDWLTCTAANPSRSELLKALGWQIVYGQAELGNDLRPWAWKGYDGITSGGASVGVRHDGAIVRLSSGCAADNWSRPVQVSEHISRLDLAVTVRIPTDTNPAREAYKAAQTATPNRRGRRITRASHIETWSEGETAYLGSRQSARFGRLYNKGLESREEIYRDCWRWEVEFKGHTATPIAWTVAQHSSTSEAVLAYVWDTFAAWGCPPLWGRGADVPLDTLHRDASDDERRLAWLSNQVAGVVGGLLRRGKRAAVLEALGLQ